MVDRDALRALIRDVIEAEVATLRGAGGPIGAQIADHSVRIESDADLGAFARQVLSLAGDESARQRIQAGAYPFRLAGGQGKPSSAPPSPSDARVDGGLVTEATLAKLAKGIKVLELGPGVVVTPLARERARALGIALERRRA